MARIQNPIDISVLLEREYPLSPIVAIGHTYFDDFDRGPLNMAAPAPQYEHRFGVGNILEETNNGAQYSGVNQDGSGTAQSIRSVFAAGLCRPTEGGSPFTRPRGINLRLTGLNTVSQSAEFLVGITPWAQTTGANLTDYISIKLETNIGGQVSVSWQSVKAGAAEVEALAEGTQNDRWDADITWFFGKEPELILTNEATGARETYKSGQIPNSIFPWFLFLYHLFRVNGNTNSLRAWGVRYL